MDKIVISPIKEGVKDDVVAFSLPQDAYQNLVNVYIYNGVIRRKPGQEGFFVNELQNRLRMKLGTTDGSGNLSGTVPGALGAISQQFSIDTALYTVYQASGAMYQTVATTTATFNTATGAYVFAGAPALKDVYFYPSYRVKYIYTPIEDSSSIYYDDYYSYKLTSTGFEYINTGSSIWVNPSDFIYDSIPYTENNVDYILTAKSNNLIKSYDTTAGYVNRPFKFLSAGASPINTIESAKLIKSFARRIILMYTVENESGTSVLHRNRIRWSKVDFIFDADSWYQYPDSEDKGGFIDLPSGEVINAAYILNDRLIIFCENSIYELIPTGNKLEPFSLSIIDSTFGSSSQYIVEANGKVLFVNYNGIFICDGVKVSKISEKIDNLFQGKDYILSSIIKDESKDIIIITYSSRLNSLDTDGYIIYNYKNDTFSNAINNYTALGFTNVAPSGIQYISPFLVAGNSSGYITRLANDSYENQKMNHITNVTATGVGTYDFTVISHGLTIGDFHLISIVSGVTNLAGNVIVYASDKDTLQLVQAAAIGAYNGDATFVLLDKISIQTKEFSPYLNRGLGVSIEKIALNVNRTAAQSLISVLPAIGASYFDIDLGKYIETNGLTSLENQQARVWRHVNLACSAETAAIEFLFDDKAYETTASVTQELQINALIIYVRPSRMVA